MVEPTVVLREPGMLTLSQTDTRAANPAPAQGGSRLGSVFPNPCNPRAQIEFTTGRGGPVQLAVYDLRGRLIRGLLNEPVGPGVFVVEWDGTTDSGREVGSGVYLLQLKADGVLSGRRVTLLR